MKTFILLLLVSTTSYAGWKNHLCRTEMPTTSIYTKVEGLELVATVIHHNGAGYLPLTEGIFTPNDLPLLATKADRLKSLGDKYEFRWNLADCQGLDEELLYCHKGKETVINGVSVVPWSISSRKGRTESRLGVFENIQVSFLMDIGGVRSDDSLTMDYQKYECFDI